MGCSGHYKCFDTVDIVSGDWKSIRIVKKSRRNNLERFVPFVPVLSLK